MDLVNLQIEGISRSKYNLKNYEFSSRKILGNRRLIHVSIPDEPHGLGYQKFSKSAQNLWEAHSEVLDEYARIFNKNRTPSKKRKMNITHR